MRDITIVNVDEIDKCVTCKEVEFRYPICESCISGMLKGFSKDK